ncbi:Transmembrane channel 7, partial [Brachionus plicatilis]
AKAETSDSKNSKNQYTYVTSLKSIYSTGKKLKKWLPWHSTLAKIETKYGGSFVSLFELNRWLFIINFVVALLAGSFIIAPQYAYNLDETSNRLDITNNGTNLSETCKNIMIEENNQNRTDFLESSTSNSSIEESILLSKCCYYNYTEYLKKRDENKTTIDVVLDIFQGTVKINSKNLRFYAI